MVELEGLNHGIGMNLQDMLGQPTPGTFFSAFKQSQVFFLVIKGKPGHLKKSLGPRFSHMPGSRGAAVFPECHDEER